MMNKPSRREFLRVAAAAGPLAAIGMGAGAEGVEAARRHYAELKNVVAGTGLRPRGVEGGFVMGAQSFSFRKFDLAGSIQCLKDVGLDVMEFCSVHFPPDATHEGFAEVKALLAREQVKVPCYGVEGFGGDAAANRKKFEFAQALGVEVLTADVELEAFDNVEALCEEFGVKIALHNHGPGARYDKVADVLKATAGRSPLIGACVDTGHYLRSSENPHEVIEALGDRVISLHLKDWIIGGEEQILGKGDMDLVATAKALKAIRFNGPAVMEYEESADNPVPDMKEGWANWQAAWAQA